MIKEEPSKAQELRSQVFSRQEYAKANFWDQRYSQNSGFFDWYAEYPELKNAYAEYNLNIEDRILMVGCGNSKLSYQMWEAGYKNIVNIDISPSVIEQMSKQFPDLVWQVMDATKMSYKDGEFDVIIDKGTLDALITGKNYDICYAMLRECMRVTKQNGQMLLITYGSPEGRRKVLQPALPFEDYDYYQCRAELNDISTLINLMRSNGDGKPLKEIVTDKVAFAKTLKEFSIIKMLRRRRKNQKQYILWKSIDKKQLEFNPTYLKELKVEERPPKATGQEQQTVSETQQQKKESVTIEQASYQNKVTYQPKKQPYVYVYSIRRKFASALQTELEGVTVEQLEQKYKGDQATFRADGSNELCPFSVYTHPSNFASILQSLQFLRNKNIPHSSCILTNNYSISLADSLRINVISSIDADPSMLILRKTNLRLKINFNEKQVSLEAVNSQLNKLSRKLVTVCNLYPCPKTYAMFHAIKSRVQNTSVNVLLDKYWFPTVQVLTYAKGELLVKISIPPVLKQKELEIIKTIENTLKKVKIEIIEILQGFLSFFDIELYNILNMASLSYNNQRMHWTLQEFWERDELCDKINSEMLVESQLYNQLYCTAVLKQDTLARSIAHALAFY